MLEAEGNEKAVAAAAPAGETSRPPGCVGKLAPVIRSPLISFRDSARPICRGRPVCAATGLIAH